MEINKDCLLLIAEFEGLSLKPYLCSAKKATIGYGNTYYKDGRKVTMLDNPITKDEAVTMLKDIVKTFGKEVNKLVTSPINQNQYNALVSFAYNVGITNLKNSTLLKLVNKDPNQLAISNEFLKWVNAGGQKIKGLEKRRVKESQIYFKK
jgi:lysozyme